MKKYIQVLNVISCLSVVYLHVNCAFLAFSYEPYWISANIIECVFYFAVPVFFMISGCNLFDYRKRYSTKIFLKKRVKKTVVPFFAWSLIAFLYMSFIQKSVDFSNITITSFLGNIINTNYLPMYWFFIPLFVCYLCIPVLSKITENGQGGYLDIY